MRLLDYMAREGFRATVKKAANKISAKLGGKSSETVFLCRMVQGFMAVSVPTEYQIRELSESDIDEFAEFNFFPHIEVSDYVSAEKDGALGCFEKGELIGYVCYESEKIKTIHGTGDFILSKSEAWIGPCYVDRMHRGKGLNKALVQAVAASLAQKGIITLFTSINGANTSSLASFKKMGFQEFALYSVRCGVRPVANMPNDVVSGSVLKEKILISKTKKGN